MSASSASPVEGAEHEAVHLVEDDLLILEHRRPAEALDIEAARAREIGDAEGDDGNLLLHVTHPSLADAPCAGTKGGDLKLRGSHQTEHRSRCDRANHTGAAFFAGHEHSAG